MPKIVAKDCMPFYKKEKVICDGKESEQDSKILSQFANGIVPISIFGETYRDNDADSRLAYSPYENKPFTFKTNDGLCEERVWQAGRYVGSTQIGNYTIQIEPRFGQQWLENIMDEVFHFRITKSESDPETGKIDELMRRILWHLWIRKFALADQYGLPKRTAKRVYVGLQVRGHLNARKSILPLFTKQQIVSEYREKELDEAICGVVYQAYNILVNRKMNRINIPPAIQDSLNSLYSHYRGQHISVTPHEYYGICYKSIYQSWKQLVDFSWQIIQQEAYYKHKETKGNSFSIFLDMAEIWESFLRKKLGDGFAKDGWRVLSIDECRFRIYKDTFYERDIIPDIILQRDNDYMVFDAKYKRMRGIKTDVKHSDVDRADLFQIHTYIQYVQHHLGNVVLGGLLYPISKESSADSKETQGKSNQLDINSYHSPALFGCTGTNKIPFIIDGIDCSNANVNEAANEMIERINKLLNTSVAIP